MPGSRADGGSTAPSSVQASKSGVEYSMTVWLFVYTQGSGAQPVAKQQEAQPPGEGQQSTPGQPPHTFAYSHLLQQRGKKRVRFAEKPCRGGPAAATYQRLSA